MNFRVARHTTNIDLIKNFYTEILGLEILGKFENHNGYNGIFIGKINLDWHLEFTESTDNANHKFDEDDILVFYPNNEIEFEQILTNVKVNEVKIHSAKNPYWNENGVLIKDPDNFNVIISSLKIKK